MISKKKMLYLIVIIFVSVTIVSSLVTYYCTRRSMETGEIYVKGKEYEALMKYFELEDVKEIIKKNYIRDVNDSDLFQGSLAGAVGSLNDGYSTFYAEEDYKYFDEESEGSFIAQGMMLTRDQDEDYVKVSRIFADTSAYDANILVGDLILSIDGKDTRYMDIETALGRIRGLDGTKVALKIRSNDKDIDVELIRKSPEIQVVFTDMVNDEIGYVNIAEFSGSSVGEFEKAIDTMKNEKAKGIIIDLRGTLGGNISQAAKIADLLLEEGNICKSVAKNNEATQWNSVASTIWDKPIVIIVDRETAGVAEVFAAALQDRQRAKVLGEKTLGKAAVTTYYQIPSTGDMIKLVTAEYYMPSGKKITGQGVTPDEVLSEADLQEGTSENSDTALVKAAKLLNEML